MATVDERNLVLQGYAKCTKDPIYHPTQEERQAGVTVINEWVDCIEMIKQHLVHGANTMQPDESPQGKITSIFDAQNPYVQKKIRRHHKELIEIEARRHDLSDSDLDVVLKRYGLRGDLVSPDDVWTCLFELRQEIFHHYIMCEYELGEEALQHYDFNLYPVEKMAEELELELIEINKKRYTIVGLVICVDNRAALIKFCNGKVVRLPFMYLAQGQDRPKISDTVQIKMNEGVLEVRVAAHKRSSCIV